MLKGFRKYVKVRFYGSLNDFLPLARRQTDIQVGYWGKPSVKDLIESQGVPHVEVFLVLVNSQPVNFEYRPAEEDLISCYPKFESIPYPEGALHLTYPNPPKFVLDVHLGRLAAFLRLLGIDTSYSPGYSDDFIIRVSVDESRIILTRDKGILRNGSAVLGYFLRNTNPAKQLEEVTDHFNLKPFFNPFSRCSLCNGQVQTVDKQHVKDLIPETTFSIYEEFYRCSGCGQIYWEGPQYEKIKNLIDRYLR